MRIVYVVDIHDRFAAVERAIARTGPVDVLVVGGDITTAGSPAEAERAIELWRPLAPRLLAVAGNMDSPAIDERLVELGVSIDGRGVVLDEVGLHGVSASPFTPLDTPHELPDEELGRRAEAGRRDVAGCRIRIFCPHAPPYDTACDRLHSGVPVGSPSVRAFVEREQPDLVLCGHIHESRGEDTIGRSRIVNPGPAASGHYALVEVDDAISVALD
ncbi:MAG TPA: metallophosphoesterase [Gaiellaceae bacterium]|nr:metallophosphoesterase [Gaiellaceae bacterium]